MHIEMIDALPIGKDGKALGAVQAVVRWDADGTVAELAKTIEEKQLSSLSFVDAEFFFQQGKRDRAVFSNADDGYQCLVECGHYS